MPCLNEVIIGAVSFLISLFFVGIKRQAQKARII